MDEFMDEMMAKEFGVVDVILGWMEGW